MNFSPKINRKNTALFLTALFMISATVVLITASEDVTAADTEYEDGPWTYVVNSSGNAVITKWDWSAVPNGTDSAGTLTLPEKLKADEDTADRTVVEIRGPNNAPADSTFYPSAAGVKKIELPESLSILSGLAFGRAATLETIDLSNVTSIGGSAFSGCTLLKDVVFPKGECIIGSEAFRYCDSLEDIDLKGATEIRVGAFRDCESLASVIAPNVETVAMFAFYDCPSLVDLDLKNVVSIEKWAIRDCTSLVTIDVSSILNTEPEAFWGCTALETIVVPDKINMGDMFIRCDNIKEYLVTENSDYASDKGVLYTKDMKTLVRVPPAWETANFIVPDSVETFEEKVFKGYAKLVSVDISRMTVVKDETFYGCTSLEYIDLAMISYVGDRAFYNCAKLQSLDMVEVEHIGEEAFLGCHNFTMAIAIKAKYVGDYAFTKCDGLLVASFPDAKYVGQLRECRSLRSLDVSGATFVGGALVCMSLDDVKLPETPYKLKGFWKCGLKTLDLKGATDIVKQGSTMSWTGFTGCLNLKYFSAPNLVTMVGNFEGCTSLAYVYLPLLETPATDENVQYELFKGCIALDLVCMPKVNISGDPAMLHSIFRGATVDRLVVKGISSSAIDGEGFSLNNLFFTSDYKSGLIPSNISKNTKIYRLPDATGWNESYGIFHTIGFYVGEHKVLDDVVADNGRIREPFLLKDDRVWTLNGEVFDFNQRITSDLVLRDGAAPVHIVDDDKGDVRSNTGTILAAVGSVIAIIVVAVIFLLRRPA